MEQIRIDLVPGGVTPNAHATQYDVGRAIRFLLYNGGNSYTLAGTETITVDVTKPDGSTDTVSVTNTSSNYVDFVTTDGLLNQAGLYPCEISIVNGTDVIGSQNFNLRAEADAYDGADIVTVTVGPTDICTFTTNLAEPLQSVTVDVEATGGNGTPDNPNPINGYSSTNITRCGVNLFDGSKVTTTTPSNWGVSFDSDTSTLTIEHKNTYSSGMPVFNIPSFVGDMVISGTFGANIDLYVNGTWNRSMVSGTPFSCTSGNTYTLVFPNPSQSTLTYKVQLELGNTASTFAPYNGQTYTVNFGQTVYGGVLDVTRGKLTVTHKATSLTDMEEATIGGVTVFIKTLSDAKLPASNSEIAKIDMAPYTPIRYNGVTTNVDTIALSTASLLVVNTGSSTPPVGEVRYELATPFDIDLTPVQIRALVRENNVFADCGQTELKYLKAGN